MKKYFLFFLLFCQNIFSQEPMLLRANMALAQLHNFSFQDQEKITVVGDSANYECLLECIQEIVALANATKKFQLEVDQIDSNLFVYRDPTHGIRGHFLVFKFEPGQLAFYGEGSYRPSSGFYRAFAQTVTLGAINFPIHGRGFITVKYNQNGQLVENNFNSYLETDNGLTNTFAKHLVKRFYRKTIINSLKFVLEKILKTEKSTADSLVFHTSSN